MFFFYLLLIACGTFLDINQLVKLHTCFNFLKEINEQKKILYKHTYACALLSLTISSNHIFTTGVRFSLLLYKKKIRRKYCRTDFFLYMYREIIHHHPFSSAVTNLFLNHVFDRFLFSCSSAAYRNG